MRIILLGPTASGKTTLSTELAEALQIPIISVDSRQCFKHLDIGTAKPSPNDLKRVHHFNISNLELDEPDTVQAFKNRADQWEADILKNHEHVLYVGGSTLHLQSLIRPVDDLPTANEQNLDQLSKEIEEDGLELLYKRLKEVDPDYHAKMDGMNRQRILRALDVWMQTGLPFSSFHTNDIFELPPDTLVFGLDWSRPVLYTRINQRVDDMMNSGFIKETQDILEKGYSKELQPLNAVGYREIISFLEGNLNLNVAVEKIKTQTRRYAKRQLTWFRRWDFVEWLPAELKKNAELVEIIQSRLAAKLDKQ